jgi:LPS export ABC transporter permease LptG
LAVSAPKSGRAAGFALGLVTVIVFYMLFANGIRMASVGKINPWLAPWIANIILSIAGLFLLSKAEKRFALTHWLTLIPWRLPKRFSRSRVEKPTERARENGDFAKTISRPSARRASLFPRFPKILDFYILRGFLTYFLWSLAACTTLFLLLTIFELLDDAIRNSISIISLADYLIFLTPQVLIVGIPMSILLAALVSLGVLEKDSEITATKANGWSLYRLAVPIIAASVFFSIGLFLMQDYVLPYANNRQDNLRNYILNKPARTSRHPERKWILGDQGRIYNYGYFDGSQNSFVDLNVYEVDFDRSRLRRRIYAEKARVGDGIWTIENGWLRDYESEQFERFEKKTVGLPERAGYFKREIFQPKESSKLTYLELRQYIGYLRQSGYNAIELQVELYKKAAFPASCLIMALMGIPFAFSVGRKGAFFGIGVSIAIAVVYWGISGAFEAMGAYGMLFPLIAAWAPNILFAAAGLTMFLTIRT